MTKLLLGILLLFSLSIPVTAMEITAPEVPPAGFDRMPDNTASLGDGLLELIQRSTKLIRPELENACKICTELIGTALLFSLLPVLTEKMRPTVSVARTAAIAAVAFQHTTTLISHAAETVWEICEYGKLLCPVLTTALAAQGGISTSAALYTGTTAFISWLSMIVSRWIIPMIYIFLTLSIANSALGEDILKKFADAVKHVLQWLLRTLLIVFTTFLSITGVVSGTTDLAAAKTAKVMISSVVPVVGGILSDASESVLVSIGIMKNAAGIYGILAVLAIFTGPFIRVGIQYLLLKVSSAVCSLFADKNIAVLIEDFSAAMGILLAMVAVSCILVLISTACFMKGIG